MAVKNVVFRLDFDSKGAKEGAKDYEKSAQKVEKSNQGIAGSLKKIGALIAVTFAASKIKDFASAAVSEFAQFEKALSSLSAITGATGLDLEFYKSQAEEIGKTTTIAAADAVKAFELIGSAKPELLANKEALAAVTREAITLAEASGLELPDAAKALTGALNQFGAGAGQASKFINVLAAGAKEGAAAIPLVAEGLLKFGAVAKGANVSVEESVGLMELLAEKGLQGAEAGTSLRNVLLKLSASEALPKEAIDTLEAAGVSTEILSDKSLTLEERLAELGKIQDDTTALVKVFGTENVVAASNILKNQNRLRDLTKAVTGTKTAYEQAATQTENLESTLTRLGNTFDVILGQIGEALAPVVGGVADLAQGFLELIAPSEKASEQLENQRQAINILRLEITDANITDEERKKKLEELVKLYPQLSDRIDINTVSNAELVAQLKKVNQEMINQIKLAVIQEEIEAKRAQVQEAVRKEREKTVLFNERLNAAQERTGETFEDTATKAERVEAALKALGVRYTVVEKDGEAVDFTINRLSDSMFGNEQAAEDLVAAFRGVNRAVNSQEHFLADVNELQEEYNEQAKNIVKNGGQVSDVVKAMNAALAQTAKTTQDASDAVGDEGKKGALAGSLAALREQLSKLKKELEENIVATDRLSFLKKAQEIDELDAKIKMLEKTFEDFDIEKIGDDVGEFDPDKILPFRQSNFTDAIIEAAGDSAKDYAEALQSQLEEQAKNLDLAGFISSAVGDVAGIIGDVDQTITDNRLKALDRQYEEDLERAGDNAQKKEKIEANYDKARESIEREAFERQKKLQIAQALISGAQSVISILASSPDPLKPLGPLYLAQIALAAATTAGQIGIIAAQQFAEGEIGIFGPGSETSDDIPAWLSRGESVITAKRTRQYRPALEAIHNGLISPDLLNSYVLTATRGDSFTDAGIIGATDKQTRRLVAKLDELNGNLRKSNYSRFFA